MCEAKYKKNASELVERLLPVHVARQIIFEEIRDFEGKDVFELESLAGKIVIRGNSSNAMAVGLNHYLKYLCCILGGCRWYGYLCPGGRDAACESMDGGGCGPLAGG